MPSITALRGLPGSGKSTKARQYLAEATSPLVRVNRDDLRGLMYNGSGILDFDKEEAITKVERLMVENAVRSGSDVIIDNTNLRNKYLTAWNRVANALGVEFKVEDVIANVDDCVARDALRPKPVGEEVIRTLAQKFTVNGVFTPYEPLDPNDVGDEFAVVKSEWIDGLEEVVVVDLDGTMALNLSGRGWFDWSKVGQDSPNEPVVDLVTTLLSHGYRIVFMSGRDEVCRTETEFWLRQVLPNGYTGRWDLHMRAEGDNRSDDIVKYELFDQHIRGQVNVKFILDDRDKVVKMWRNLGLTCLQVAPGDF